MFVAGFVLSQIYLLCCLLHNFFRWPQADMGELEKNVLLTKETLVFISGQASAFYFGHYWNHLPKVLQEHGYTVLEAKLQSRSYSQRQQNLELFLRQYPNTKFHFIFDRSTQRECRFLIEHYQHNIQSVTSNISQRKKQPFRTYSIPYGLPWLSRLLTGLICLPHYFLVPSFSVSAVGMTLLRQQKSQRNHKWVQHFHRVAEKDLLLEWRQKPIVTTSSTKPELSL